MGLQDDLDAALADAENQVVVAFDGATVWGNRVVDVAQYFPESSPIPRELAGDELVLVRRDQLPGLEPKVEIQIDGVLKRVTRIFPGPDAAGAMVILSLETIDAEPS